MDKSRAYALSGCLFAVIGISAIGRHDLIPGMAMFALAIAASLRSHDEWQREHA